MIGRGWKWLLATLLVALVVHGAGVVLLPRLVMLRTMTAIAKQAGINTIMHAPRATWQARAIVRPSPDLLYSICVYDLDAAGGAVRVSTHDMPQTYWSVSVFDADTNNFYALNDLQAKKATEAGAADFILMPQAKSAVAGRLPAVAAPTNRGIVLFRTLVNDEAHIAAIDAARHNTACEPYKAG
jgi:uncharacterized membrane protein